MIASVQRCVLLIVASLVVAGCANTAARPNSSSPTGGLIIEKVSASTTLNRLDDTVEGEILALYHEELEPGDYRVVAAYAAASGRECRRITHVAGSDVRIACRRDNGDWTLTRRLTQAPQGVRSGALLG